MDDWSDLDVKEPWWGPALYILLGIIVLPPMFVYVYGSALIDKIRGVKK